MHYIFKKSILFFAFRRILSKIKYYLSERWRKIASVFCRNEANPHSGTSGNFQENDNFLSQYSSVIYNALFVVHLTTDGHHEGFAHATGGGIWRRETLHVLRRVLACRPGVLRPNEVEQGQVKRAVHCLYQGAPVVPLAPHPHWERSAMRPDVRLGLASLTWQIDLVLGNSKTIPIFNAKSHFAKARSSCSPSSFLG